MSVRWHIEVLGRFRLVGGETEIVRFSSQRAACLLAYLVCRKGVPQPREVLIELLWPECDPALGRNRLSVVLSSLRRQLEPPGVCPGAVLDSNRQSVRLCSDGCTTDLEAFLAAERAWRRAPAEARTDCLMRAARLYVGELLPGLYDEWVEVERRAIRELSAGLARDLRRIVRENPGRLDREPGVEAEAIRLSRLLEGAGSGSASAFEAAEGLCHGATSLQEESVQVSSDRTPAGRARRAPLPPVDRTYVGRRVETDQVAGLLRSSGLDEPARLVSLVGPGGVGKTRLAVEVGNVLDPTFAGRVGFVRLDDAENLEQAESALISALRLTLVGEESLAERLGLYSGDGPCLLILDNFEQLVEVGGPEWLNALLESAPTLQCLVTSRRLLRIPSEHAFSVGPLELPEGEAVSPEEAMNYSAIRLFVARGQQARPDFQITPQSVSAIVRLCRRLDGLPLSIELAAAQMQVTTPAKLYERLGSNQALVGSRRRATPPRHRSLDVAFAWSVDRLSDDSRVELCKLAMFRRSWDAPAAELLLGSNNCAEQLSSLAEWSLIQPYQSAVGVRFRLLDTLRAHLRELADFSQDVGLMARFAGHFAEVAADLSANLVKGDASVVLAEFDADYANMEYSLVWALEHQPDLAVRLSSCLGAYWHSRGLWVQGRRLLESAIAVAPDSPRLRLHLCRLLERLGEHNQAADVADVALRGFQELGDRLGEADALCVRCSGSAADRREKGLRALAIYESLGNLRGAARAELNVGIAVRDGGDIVDARHRFARALRRAREAGDLLIEAEAANALGVSALDRRDWSTAETLLRTALEIAEAAGDQPCCAMVHCNLAIILIPQRRSEDAGLHARAALAAYRQMADLGGVLLSLRSMVDVLREEGHYSDALRLAREGLELAERRGSRWGRCIHLEAMATLLTTAGRVRSAALMLGFTLAWRERHGLPMPDELMEMKALIGEAAGSRFEEWLSTGAQLNLDEALALTLELPPRARVSPKQQADRRPERCD